jgi:hypothetical protein
MSEQSYLTYPYASPIKEAFTAVNKMVSQSGQLFQEYPVWQEFVQSWTNGTMSFDGSSVAGTKIALSNVPEQLKSPMLKIVEKVGYFMNAFDYLVWREDDPTAPFVRKLCNEIMTG